MSKGLVRQEESAQEPRTEGEVLVRATVPCSDFALADTFSRVPEAQFDCGSVAGTGDDVMPLLWARAPDHDRLEAALREDSSTAAVTPLTDHGDERLYRIVWEPTVAFVVRVLTTGDATMLDASADREGWQVRLLYPTRDDLAETSSYCERHGVSMNVQSIQQMGGGSSGQYGLTETQYEALTLACEQGYFDIPRETDLGEVAEMLGISHQALSERLRRGTEKLVSQSLLCDRTDDLS